MGANLNTTFVVDVEATCWDTQNGERAEGPNEVIEIGIVALDLKTLNVTKKGSYVVKPRSTKVSPFCTQLTGWTQQDVDGAPDILQVLSTIRADFGITRNHTWWSGGEYDRYKLSSDPNLQGSLGFLYKDFADARVDGIDINPFESMRAHYNIKTLLAMKMGWKREKGLARSLAAIGATLEGRHHNGADDAYNTAKLVARLLRKS